MFRKNKASPSDPPYLSDYDTDTNYLDEDIEILGTVDDSFYGDNDYIDSLESQGRKPEDEEHRPNKKSNIMMLLVAAVLFVGLITIMLYTGNTSVDNAPGEQDVSQSEQEQQPNFDGIVVREENGVTYSGNVDGSPVNGTGAILSFDYSYYTGRDGSKVVEDLSPTVGTDTRATGESLSEDEKKRYGDFYQSHIDKVPEGTTYTLDITPVRIGEEYQVVLHLDIPQSKPVSYVQDFKTVKIGDRYYVQNFTSQKLNGSTTSMSRSSS